MNDNGEDKFWRLFYLLKLTRFVSAMRFLDVPLIMRMIKKFSVSRMAEAIKDDKELAEDITQDNNNIEGIMKFGFFLKTFKLVIVIINTSFFMGVFWLIYCQVSMYVYEEFFYNGGI
jgi:hypothetical protein